MQILTETFLEARMGKAELDKLFKSQYQPADVLMSEVEALAISQLSSYLCYRYDFEKMKGAKEAYFLFLLTEIFLYYASNRQQPNAVPENLRTRYQEAVATLEVISGGGYSPQAWKIFEINKVGLSISFYEIGNGKYKNLW